MTELQNALTLVMKMKSVEEGRTLEQQLRQIEALPAEKNPIRVALEKIATVHFARFVFIDGHRTLAVITTYDDSLDEYLNEFIDEIGNVFNEILKHVKGAPPLPVQEHRAEFIAYVKAHDRKPVAPQYSAYPGMSVLDIRAALREAQAGT